MPGWMGMMLAALALVAALCAVTCYQVIGMPGQAFKGDLPPATEPEKKIQAELAAHVEKLASDIGERNWQKPDKLEQAAQYIERCLKGLGLEVTTQEFKARGQAFRNIEAEIKGSNKKDEILVVGAHYDSVDGCPGADDNASGVAALLALAKMSAGTTPSRTVRFVAFVNEEPPFFRTSEQGSYHYARACKERGDKLVGMLSLETIAYYSDAAKSQSFPPPFEVIYPTTGNFIGFVGNLASRPFVLECVNAFRETTSFPSEGVTAPEWVEGIDWSDQLWFWDQGYPALMVTDTAPFRNPHYHRDSDLPGTLDFERTARVVAGLDRVVAKIAARESSVQ